MSDLIEKKPSSEIRTGYVWHIGNIQRVGSDGLLFAVGRTTIASKELYDESSGDFLQIEDEESPFTYVFYDLKFSVIAIAAKSRLSPTVKGISRSIEKLLNAQVFVQDNNIRIEVAEIWDPASFIQQVMQAYAVVGFTVEFGEPNPFDVEKDFHGPMERYLAATGGQKGKANVQGDNLDTEKIEQITRSIASTGNEATAKLRLKKGQRPVTRHLKGDQVSVVADEIGDPLNALNFLSKIRDAYNRVRNSGDE